MTRLGTGSVQSCLDAPVVIEKWGMGLRPKYIQYRIDPIIMALLLLNISDEASSGLLRERSETLHLPTIFICLPSVLAQEGDLSEH